ncbi:MAG: dipicolinate synthase subunit B [Firmicutes bacterium]|nr:dipicolinate synthase subunit B [Bacillota bacterium]
MDKTTFAGRKIGFALTGSFCTLDLAVTQMAALRQMGAEILPVISNNVRDMDSRFGTAEYWRKRILDASGADKIIDNIPDAEPIGPQKLCEIMLIAPCTGNTISKLANGVIDTPVLLAAKSHLRNAGPLVIAVATNDGLSANAKNIGKLLNYKYIFFVPFGQDNPSAKPNSLVAHMEQIPQTLEAAFAGKQIQPILTCQA